MGCFNLSGFYTHQVITYKDKCVGFLAVNYSDPITRNDYITIPISFPIFGEYNDYGSLENTEKTEVVVGIEKFFGYSIDDILRDINNCYDGYLTLENNKDRYYDKYLEATRKLCYYLEPKPDALDIKDLPENVQEIINKHSKEIQNNFEEHIRSTFRIVLCIDHRCLWDVYSKDRGLFTVYGDNYEVIPADFNCRTKFLQKVLFYNNLILYISNYCFQDKTSNIYRELFYDFSEFLFNLNYSGYFKFSEAPSAGQEYDIDIIYEYQKALLDIIESKKREYDKWNDEE